MVESSTAKTACSESFHLMLDHKWEICISICHRFYSSNSNKQLTRFVGPTSCQPDCGAWSAGIAESAHAARILHTPHTFQLDVVCNSSIWWRVKCHATIWIDCWNFPHAEQATSELSYSDVTWPAVITVSRYTSPTHGKCCTLECCDPCNAMQTRHVRPTFPITPPATFVSKLQSIIGTMQVTQNWTIPSQAIATAILVSISTTQGLNLLKNKNNHTTYVQVISPN